MAGPIETELSARIQKEFAPEYLDVQNESHMHSVPKNSETHFKLIVVSTKFQGLTRIARQRLVNEAVKDLITPGKIHALTQKTMTPEEWDNGEGARGFVSPNCRGGSRADS